MKDVADLRELFCENFYFGCEADDRMLAVAFNRAEPARRAVKPCSAPTSAIGT